MHYFKALFLLIPFFIQAQPKKLIFKQSIRNLRYIDKIGETTYFSLPSGQLLISRNFKNNILIKSKQNAQFTVRVNQSKTFSLIELKNEYYSNSSFFKTSEFYISKFASSRVNLIAKAHRAKIFDEWVSYTNINEKKIYFVNLKNSLESSIRYQAFSPYFIPSVQIIGTQFYFTSQNRTGETLIVKHLLNSSKNTNIYKTSSNLNKIELAAIDKNLIIGEFSLASKKSSQINSYSIENNKMTSLYQSDSADIGHLTSIDSSIFFIKNNNNKNQLHIIDFNSKKITSIQTEFEIAQYFIMDKNIISQSQGQLWIIYGEQKKKDINL